MPTDRQRLIAAGALALGLAGCAGDEMGLGSASDAGWGEANRQTMAAQIIDPDPQYDTAMAESSGEHAAKAIERYRLDKVKLPDKVQTSNVGLSGGGGAGGGN